MRNPFKRELAWGWGGREVATGASPVIRYVNIMLYQSIGILWRFAFLAALLVTICLLLMTASVWIDSEFVKTTFEPKETPPPARQWGDVVTSFQSIGELVEVPARPFAALLSAVLSPFQLFLLCALVLAAFVTRANTHARRILVLMAFLMLDRVIVFVFCMRIVFSTWKG